MAQTYDQAWQLATLRESVDAWNKWREDHPDIVIDLPQADLRHMRLSHANLSHANLSHANLTSTALYGVNLSEANLTWANLTEAEVTKTDLCRANLTEAQLRRARLRATDLSGALLRKADLTEADMSCSVLSGAGLREAVLTGADLSCAVLSKADLRGATLRGADLCGADLEKTNCLGADFTGAILSGCHIYGMSRWNGQLAVMQQQDLCITPLGLPEITVDNLKVAQLFSLLLDNADVHEPADTITGTVVLILGRYLGERIEVLDALRNALRRRGYRPVACNFKKLRDGKYTEAIALLARMARFIIADLTHPGGTRVAEALDAIVPTIMVPVQPLVELGYRSWEPYKEYFLPYPWVLPVQTNTSRAQLLASIPETIILPAEAKAEDLRSRSQHINRPHKPAIRPNDKVVLIAVTHVWQWSHDMGI